MSHAQAEAQALKARLGELEADHRAAIAAHSALEEHLDAQAAVQKELASLQSAHAGLQAEHTRSQAELAVAEERLSNLQGLQLSHDGLQVRLSSSCLSSIVQDEWHALSAPGRSAQKAISQ